MSSPTPTAIVGRKLQSLDGLRAIAIISVFLFHMHLQNHYHPVNLIANYIDKYIDLGWMGVDLFFVISGFLITGILLDTRDASNYFGAFYARRILRIFPIYYLLLTLVILGGIELNSPEVSATLPLPQDRWLYFCFLTNWLGLWKDHWDHWNYLSHFWSLAVEEQFYLFWPLVVWLVRPRTIPWIAGSLAALAAIVRVIWVAHSGAQQAIAFATICRMDTLFVGALCAFLFHEPGLMEKVRKWLPWVASLSLGAFLAAFSGMLFFPHRAAMVLYHTSTKGHTLSDATMLLSERGGYTLLALGFGGLVLLAASTETENNWMQKILQSRVLRPIGIYSYGIYLFHMPIVGAASFFLYPRIARGIHTQNEAVFNECAYFTVLAVVIFVVSALSYELFEKRVMRLKRYFEPKYAAVSKGPTLGNIRASDGTIIISEAIASTSQENR